MHFAAHALVGESMQNPTKYFRNNVSNGINLLDASVENRVRKVIFSSTCATYGIPETLPITEGTPQIPVNPYGESKLIMERILKWYHQIHGMEFTALRYFNAAGASAHFGEHHRIETHLVPNLLFVALGNKAHAEIYGTDYATPDGTCVRDYVHVADISRAHELALRSDVHGCFNLGTGIGFSVREVHRVCEEISGRKIHIIEKTRRSGDPARLVATATLANAKLGWIPQFTRLDKIVETAWNWHLRYPQGYSD